MRASDTSEVVFQDCRLSPADSCSARKGRASSTRCRCSTPAASASPRCRSASRRGPTRRRALREGAPPVRPADRRVPGDPVEAGRRGDQDRSVAAAHLSRRVPEGPRPAHDARVGDGQALRQRDRGRVADDCVQIHGGYGFVKDYPAEKYFRDVKLLTIGEGTSEIQRLVIARQLCSVTVTARRRRRRCPSACSRGTRAPSRAPSA